MKKHTVVVEYVGEHDDHSVWLQAHYREADFLDSAGWFIRGFLNEQTRERLSRIARSRTVRGERARDVAHVVFAPDAVACDAVAARLSDALLAHHAAVRAADEDLLAVLNDLTADLPVAPTLDDEVLDDEVLDDGDLIEGIDP